MFELLRSQRGISIVGAVFTLIVLGIFGSAIVTLVSTEHEMRASLISEERSFYGVQAGLEYAMREIDQGGFPIVTGKAFANGSFSTSIDFSQHLILVTGTVGGTKNNYRITCTRMGGDCVAIDGSKVSLSGTGKTDLLGLTFKKTCNTAVTIDKIKFVWQPNNGEKVKKIVIDNVPMYDSGSGATSGTLIDISNIKISDSITHQVNLARFSGSMKNKQMYLVTYLTDSTYRSQVFNIGN